MKHRRGDLLCPRQSRKFPLSSSTINGVAIETQKSFLLSKTVKEVSSSSTNSKTEITSKKLRGHLTLSINPILCQCLRHDGITSSADPHLVNNFLIESLSSATLTLPYLRKSFTVMYKRGSPWVLETDH